MANCILFDLPESHFRSLKKLFVDDIAYSEHWQRFIRKLIREWQESAFAVCPTLPISNIPICVLSFGLPFSSPWCFSCQSRLDKMHRAFFLTLNLLFELQNRTDNVQQPIKPSAGIN